VNLLSHKTSVNAKSMHVPLFHAPHCRFTADMNIIKVVKWTVVAATLYAGPCTRNNGGCSQYCWTTSSTTRVCDCSLGFFLASDAAKCISRKTHDITVGLLYLLNTTNVTEHQFQIDGIALEVGRIL